MDTTPSPATAIACLGVAAPVAQSGVVLCLVVAASQGVAVGVVLLVVGAVVTTSVGAVLALLAQQSQRNAGTRATVYAVLAGVVAGAAAAFAAWAGTTVVLLETGVLGFIDDDGREQAWALPALALVTVLTFVLAATGVARLLTRPAPDSSHSAS